MTLSDDYKPPIHFALIQQVIISVLCLLMLDGGQLAKLCGITLLGYWAGVALMMICRPHSPTYVDKQLIKFSFVPLFVAAGAIALVM